MIGVDTNVLVRHLVQDDPVQSPRATALLETLLTRDRPAFVSIVTMAETVWVLERVYRFNAQQIVAALEGLLGTVVLIVDREREVYAATLALKEGRGSFSDALVAAIGRAAGCSHTMTFDRKAARLPDFDLL